MKSSLVINGVGNSWLTYILYGDLKFKLWQSDALVETRSNAILFWQKINIFNLKTYFSWEIFITIIFNILLLLILFNLKKKLKFNQMLFLILSILSLNIFDFCLSKEPVQMLYFLLIYLIIKNEKISNTLKFILSDLVFLLAALTFRNYYFLMAFYMVFIYFLCKVLIINNKNIKLKHIIYLTLGIWLMFYSMLLVSQKIAPSIYSELISLRTSNRGEAFTEIKNLIPANGNLIMFALNYMINVIRLVIPIELVFLGPKYFMYVLFQLYIFFYLYKSLINIKKIEPSSKVALFCILAFILGSATFEPDFGSWIRHEAIIFPIILFLSDYYKRGKKNEV